MKIENIPIIDAHCHAVHSLEPLTVTGFEGKISLSFMQHNRLGAARRPLVSSWPDDSFPRSTLMLNFLYRRLAEFLDMPCEPKKIIEARNERAADFPQYVQALMNDANIQQLVVDTGYPEPSIPVETFAGTTGLLVHEIVRIDNVMVQAAGETDDFDRFMADYNDRLDQSLRDPGCVGLKSVIAYLTGLAVDKATAADAERQYSAYRNAPWKRDFKALRDYTLLRALDLCREYNKPMQIHCGWGDDDIRLASVAPRHLYELLAFPPFSECLVVLVHGGYPWAKEAAIMANLLPNVYVDFSETCPFASFGIDDVLWELLQIAPVNKVMYGSDGFHLPELYWISAKIGRQAANRVLERLVAWDYLDLEQASKVARGIFHDNAAALYNLPA